MARWGSNDANDLCQLILGRNGDQFVWRNGGNLQEKERERDKLQFHWKNLFRLLHLPIGSDPYTSHRRPQLDPRCDDDSVDR